MLALQEKCKLGSVISQSDEINKKLKYCLLVHISALNIFISWSHVMVMSI